MKTYPPSLHEAVETIKRLVAHLKRLPFDSHEQERLGDVTEAEHLIWRHQNTKNGSEPKL